MKPPFSITVLKPLGCILFSLSALLSLIGCNKQQDYQISLVINPWPGYAFAQIASSLDYYDELGLTVRIIEQASLSDSLRVFSVGDFDMIACTQVEAAILNKKFKDLDLVPYILSDYSQGADKLIAPKSIRTITELKGRRIAAEPESLDPLMVHLALNSVGLTIKDVVIVPLTQSEMPKAFFSNEIDAAQSYHPSSTEILNKGDAHVLWDSSQSKTPIMDGIWVRKSSLQSNPEAFEKFKNAYFHAQTNFMHGNNDALAQLSEYLGVAKESVPSLFQGIHLLSEEEQDTHLFQFQLKESKNAVNDYLKLMNLD